MTIRKNSIVGRKAHDGEWSETNFRVEAVDGRRVTIRSLGNYMSTKADVDDLVLRYQVDTFESGDTVHVRSEYATRYSDVDGAIKLTVVNPKSGSVPTTLVRNNNGDEFSILNERIYLVKPAKSFKAGDRVVVDLDLAEKFGNDGISYYWENVGVMVLTEDSGSRAVQTTSHIRYENRSDNSTNNVPTRWLKLYVEPAKRVVGETIEAEDVKEGDTIRSEYEYAGLKVELSGVVGRVVNYMAGVGYLSTEQGGVIKTSEATLTLLEEAPEPVDENLQRLLDAEIGDIAHSTYAEEYWKKMGDDEWSLLELDANFIRTTEHVFDVFYKLKYGELHIFKKVEDTN